ncbi:MAG: cytochrome c biogenesis CcdA family protein [Halobacteriales archaeon]
MTAEFAGGVSLALGAGVLTFFSPCAYALLPGYIGYYAATQEGEDAPLGGALLRGVAASAGVLVVFAVLAVVAVVVGNALEPYLFYLEAGVGVALVVFGAVVVSGRGFGWHVQLPRRRASVAGFAAFGALYAVAAAGCVAPVFVSVVLQSVTYSSLGTVAVLGTYAGTFGVLMVGVTVATAVGHGVGVERVSGYGERVEKMAGLVVVAAGALQIYLSF